MAFSRVELGTLRSQFNHSFVALSGRIVTDKSIELDETMAVRLCLMTIVNDLFYERKNNNVDLLWLAERLQLDDPATLCMTMAEIHEYVIEKLDELITEQS